jgi:hypothetical protein
MAKVILTSKTSAMKSYLPILSLVLVFASCTSAYKSGQTPDDVYYSPARPQEEYVRVEKDDDRRYYSDEEYRDDRYLRMKVRDRRWSTLDDGYVYDYRYGYNYYPSGSYVYYNSWNAATLWNYYYNPYCSYNNVIIYNPKSTVYNKPRSFNLHVFDNTVNQTNPKAYRPANTKGYSGSSSNGNYNNSGTSAGGFLRNIFSGSGSSSSSSTDSKTYSSGSSSSSSSSGSSSGSSNSSSRGNATRGRN